MSNWTAATEVSPLSDAHAIHVWRLNLLPPPEAMDALNNLLSADEREKAVRFRFERDRVRYTAAHAAMRLILAGCLDCDAGAVLMTTGSAGKPALCGPAAAGGIGFNLSHSGQWGLLAVGRQRWIGVDIEQHRELPDLARLVHSVLCPAEREVLDARPADRRLECFFQMWTRKEAVVKATGGGIGSGLTAIEIEPADPALDDGAFRTTVATTGALAGQSFTFIGGYSAAVVCEVTSPRIVWRDWPVSQGRS